MDSVMSDYGPSYEDEGVKPERFKLWLMAMEKLQSLKKSSACWPRRIVRAYRHHPSHRSRVLNRFVRLQRTARVLRCTTWAVVAGAGFSAGYSWYVLHTTTLVPWAMIALGLSYFINFSGKLARSHTDMKPRGRHGIGSKRLQIVEV